MFFKGMLLFGKVLQHSESFKGFDSQYRDTFFVRKSVYFLTALPVTLVISSQHLAGACNSSPYLGLLFIALPKRLLNGNRPKKKPIFFIVEMILSNFIQYLDKR